MSNVMRMTHNTSISNTFDNQQGRTVLTLSCVVSDMAVIQATDEQGNPRMMGQPLKQQQFRLDFLPEMPPEDLAEALRGFADHITKYNSETPLTEHTAGNDEEPPFVGDNDHGDAKPPTDGPWDPGAVS